MPLDFPTSPTNGQYYNGFVYNAANETWDSAYAPRAATVPTSGYNYIINGGFDIWQRGNTFTSGYLADRWNLLYSPGTGFTRIISKLALSTSDIAGLGGDARYALRFYIDAPGTGNDGHIIQQKIEGVESLAGQTVAVSGWFRNNTSVTDTVIFELRQNFGTGGSATVFVGAGTVTLPGNSGWVKHTAIITVPSIDGKTVNTADSYLDLWINTAGNRAKNLDMYGIQVERGGVATPFRRNASSLAGELAACQRYYYRTTTPNNNNAYYASGNANGTTAITVSDFPVEMRAIPSSFDVANLNGHQWLGPQATLYSSSLRTDLSTPKSGVLVWTMSISYPVGAFINIIGSGSGGSSYMGFSAEL